MCTLSLRFTTSSQLCALEADQCGQDQGAAHLLDLVFPIPPPEETGRRGRQGVTVGLWSWIVIPHLFPEESLLASLRWFFPRKSQVLETMLSSCPVASLIFINSSVTIFSQFIQSGICFLLEVSPLYLPVNIFSSFSSLVLICWFVHPNLAISYSHRVALALYPSTFACITQLPFKTIDERQRKKKEVDAWFRGKKDMGHSS